MPMPARRALLALATAAVAVALGACGGGDDDESQDGSSGAPITTGEASVTEKLFAGTAMDNRQSTRRGQEGREAHRPLRRRRRLPRPGQDLLHVRHRDHQHDPPRPLRVPAGGERAGAGPRGRHAGDLQDGKTVTVKLKQGITYTPPVSREVTSADVKYAIERAFTANVANGYAGVYFGDLGAPRSRASDYKEIQGIETPDDSTIVFKLNKGTGAALAGALAMPISVPVPKEYAEKYDKEVPSTYGEGHAVYTGPYMVESDAEGKATGYEPGQAASTSSATPTTRPSTTSGPPTSTRSSSRPATTTAPCATRRILSGESLASGDLEPPVEPAQAPPRHQQDRALRGLRRRLAHDLDGHEPRAVRRLERPQGRDRRLQPRRRAPAARRRGARPDRPAHDPAGHGRVRGVQRARRLGRRDGLAPEPEGDRALAAEYFKKAGYASGEYEGGESLLIVGDNAEPDKSIAQITEQQLNEMGFKTKLRLVTRDTMLTRFCNVPDSEVNVCPSVGWSLDFADPQTMLDPTFNGNNIIPSQNSNWPEVDDPQINEEIDAAKLVTEPAERAQAWAERQPLDHGARALDPLHVGLPVGRRSRRTCAACRAATARPGTGTSRPSADPLPRTSGLEDDLAAHVAGRHPADLRGRVSSPARCRSPAAGPARRRSASAARAPRACPSSCPRCAG